MLEDECEWHGVTCQDEAISTNGTIVNAVIGLELPSNEMNTKIPADFVLLQSLSTLDVSDNTMEQDLSSYSWKSMVGMEVLRLDGNKFTGEISIFLELPVTLQVLSIGTNGFTGTIPEGLNIFQALTEINMEKNQLSGTISDVFTDLNVTTLRIGENNFTANAFPVFFYTMTQLEVLGLGAVNINTEIEGALEQLQQLRVLEIYGNPLNGTIPNVVLAMTSLEERRNFLNGVLPDTLGGLDALRIFDVQFNQLSGQVPDAVGQWNDTITYIEFSNNTFTGSIPSSICSTQIETLVADCDVSCTCCTECV